MGMCGVCVVSVHQFPHLFVFKGKKIAVLKRGGKGSLSGDPYKKKILEAKFGKYEGPNGKLILT